MYITRGSSIGVRLQCKFAPSEEALLFKHFYTVLVFEYLTWHLNSGCSNKYEPPVKFHFESVNSDADSMTNLKKSIILGILPIDRGRNHQPTYEFYYPSAGSCQVGFGQLLVHPFFANLVHLRQAITDEVEYDRLWNLAPNVGLSSLRTGSFLPSPLLLSDHGGQNGRNTYSVHQ